MHCTECDDAISDSVTLSRNLYNPFAGREGTGGNMATSMATSSDSVMTEDSEMCTALYVMPWTTSLFVKKSLPEVSGWEVLHARNSPVAYIAAENMLPVNTCMMERSVQVQIIQYAGRYWLQHWEANTAAYASDRWLH